MSIKSDIRHNQIRVRSLKKTYQHLSINDKKLVKLAEAIEFTNLEIDRRWWTAYFNGFHPQKNPNVPIVEFIAQLLTKNEKNQAKLARLESKLSVGHEAILRLHRRVQSRLYGGSF